MSGENGMSISEHIQRQAGMKKLNEAGVCPIVPFDDNVVAKRVKPKDKTIAGIHLPVHPLDRSDSSKKETSATEAVRNQGEVLAVGPGKPVYDEDGVKVGHVVIENVQVGDVVVINKGVDVHPDGIDGECYIICPASAIIGKVVRP